MVRNKTILGSFPLFYKLSQSLSSLNASNHNPNSLTNGEIAFDSTDEALEVKSLVNQKCDFKKVNKSKVNFEEKFGNKKVNFENVKSESKIESVKTFFEEEESKIVCPSGFVLKLEEFENRSVDGKLSLEIR